MKCKNLLNLFPANENLKSCWLFVVNNALGRFSRENIWVMRRAMRQLIPARANPDSLNVSDEELGRILCPYWCRMVFETSFIMSSSSISHQTNDLSCHPGKGQCTNLHALLFDLITWRGTWQKGGGGQQSKRGRQRGVRTGGGGKTEMKTTRQVSGGDKVRGGCGAGDSKQILHSFYLLSISLWSPVNTTCHIRLFALRESLWREAKQSSNAANVIIARSEYRSYLSLLTPRK